MRSLTLAAAVFAAFTVSSLPALAQTQKQVPQTQSEIQLSFAPVVKRVTPSVVNVYATTVTQQSASPFASDPFFQHFFGQNSPLFQQRPQTSQSLGSGVIVDSSGVILTNHHVIANATDIRISTSDGHEYAVDVVLDDPDTDLAALRVRDAGGHQFPALEIGDSDSLEVGDLVLAIGDPFGVGQTVTSGIVSALARTGVETSDYSFFIQTDAAINPGNSGGALVDLSGHLIGINSAIYSSSGGSVGIGFAIPSNMAKVVAKTAIAGGDLVRPWLGTETQALTSDLADSLNLDVPRGALITDVAPDSPAERAGLKQGDVILAIDGKAVEDPKALSFRLATKSVGTKATLSVVHDGKKQDIEVALEAAPSLDKVSSAILDDNSLLSGASVAQLSPAVAQQLDLPFRTTGVVITKIKDRSRAAAVGFKAGDVIVALNGEQITSVDKLKQVVSSAGRGWQIVLQRDGRTIRSYIGG